MLSANRRIERRLEEIKELFTGKYIETFSILFEILILNSIIN